MAAAEASDAPPPPMIGIRSRDHGALLGGLPQPLTNAFLSDDAGECRALTFSKDGSLVAWCNSLSVKCYSVAEKRLLCEIDRQRTVAMEFSPAGTFLCTWQVYAVRDGVGADNLCIWRTADGSLAKSYIQKGHEGWQPQWTCDDGKLLQRTNNQISIFEASDLSKRVQAVPVENIADFAVSPAKGPLTFAAFIKGKKGMPCSARLYSAPNYDVPLCNKSFYNAEKVSMLWNAQGTSVLVSTPVDVDKSNQSFNGETHMYFMSTKDALSAAILLDKKGPIYDVTWSPSGKQFAVVYGFMPAKVTLFNSKCDVVRDFSTGPRNFVRFSPSGHVLCIAGFGNLRGGVEFWDPSPEGKLVSKLKCDDSTAFEWCPDSRHILTATTSPRLKVDNGLKIWHYTRGLVWEAPQNELWQVCWQPAPADHYPRRPISPVPKSAETAPDSAANKPAVYRPPKARGGNAPKWKLHDDPKPAVTGGATSDADKPSKAQLKKQKKLEKEARERAEKEAAEAAAAAAAAAGPVASLPSDASAADVEKKIRNVKKKLRQTDALKERQAAGEELDEAQLEKLAAASKVEEDLAELEKILASLSA